MHTSSIPTLPMLITWGCCIGVLCQSSLQAETPGEGARPIITAGATPGVANIEPSKEHPRSSEGSFVTLKDGHILFCYTQFYGGAHDESAAHIVATTSADDGLTWGEPRVIVPNEAKGNVMSITLLRLHSGRIAMFYLHREGWTDCRACVRFSEDEGKTWSDPVRAIAAPGYFVLNNDRVIQLQSGRLVMPVAWHRSRSENAQDFKTFDNRAIALWYLSDDEGRTWREADTWWALPVVSNSGLQEPGVVETPDGSLLSWARTDQGHLYEMRSTDAGVHWTAPAPMELASPLSPLSAKMIPGTKRLLGVYNDHSGRFPYPAKKRTPLVSAISDDGGRTWQQHRVIESDPDGWYCYTAIHFVGDSVLLAYCAGDSKVGGLNRLRIRKEKLTWFLGDGSPQ